MKRLLLQGIPVLFLAASFCSSLSAQTASPADPGPAPAIAPPPAGADAGPVVLDWVPPALSQLSSQAAARSSFTLDRNMLAAAASLTNPDDATKQAIAKLDGVSVHMLNFGAPGMADPGAIEAVREAYHLRGWKHLVSTTGTGGPVHNGKADVWLVLDGVNVRGAVVLVQSPKSLTLVTVAGNISPTDLLRLRGHFGIPRFDGDGFKDSPTN
jgi:Domain of unknown function (DUF4252)